MTADPTKLTVSKSVNLKTIGLSIARLPQTDRVFVGCADFKVYEIDVSKEKLEPREFSGDGHQSYVTGMAVVGNQLITGSYDNDLIWWDLETLQPKRRVTAHERWIRKLVASADGKLVASVADDMLCKVWDAESGNVIYTLNDHKPMTPHHFPSMLYAVAFSADQRFLATGDKVGHIAIWDLSNGQKISELEAPVMYTWDPRQRRHSIGGIRSLGFSADGKLLAAGGIGTIGNIDHLDGPSRIEVFDWQQKQRIHELSDATYKGLIEQITFPREGSWFVSAGGDNGGFVSFVDFTTGKPVHQAKAPMHVHSFVMNDAQDTLYLAGHDQMVVMTFLAPPAEPAS